MQCIPDLLTCILAFGTSKWRRRLMANLTLRLMSQLNQSLSSSQKLLSNSFGNTALYTPWTGDTFSLNAIDLSRVSNDYPSTALVSFLGY